MKKKELKLKPQVFIDNFYFIFQFQGPGFYAIVTKE